ncbi:MAG TPA: glycosyltransferase [Trebonia sp.]|nr:glycosyltransferase [Trebonia sp.]
MEAPILIGELEITQPIPGIELPERTDGLAYTGVELLVRLGRVPVGYAMIEPALLDPAAVARQVWSQLSAAINARLTRRGLTALDSLTAQGIPDGEGSTGAGASGDYPMVSVVVCTRDRPDSVVTALTGLTGLHYPSFEIVVIDNAPTSSATRDAIAARFSGDSRVRYVREPRPGLSRARNRGVAEASAEIVAFTDDDVRVDPWWLNGIVEGFRAAPGAACVTGLIATAQLENSAQLYFHLREGWGTACERRVFDLVENRDSSPLYPYSPGIFGAGANFALTRTALKEIGGFDEALGAGTVSGGGEDLDLFMRVILAGHRLVYEPSAIVWHFHRTDLGELARQMRAYGTGCTAALTAIVIKRPRSRLELPPRIGRGLLRLFTLSERVADNPTLPSGLMRREIGGLLAGPWLYLKARRALRD